MDKLLIVDDEEAMRRLLRIHLSDSYEIADTGSPEHALELAMQFKPNAILLDLRMPKYSGFELCQTFHSFPATQLTPLIIVSGEAGSTTKSICKELGAAAYFEKPIDFEALRQELQAILHTVCPERRREMRVRLRVTLNLRGTDAGNRRFEEPATTENVSRSGFLCECLAELKLGSTVEVEINNGQRKYVGEALALRREQPGTPSQRYAFRFIRKNAEWIVR